MAFTDKGAQEALKSQEHADRLAATIREQKREQEVENEFNKKHNIKTPEDAERFIQKCKDEIFAKTAKMQYSKPGKKNTEEGLVMVAPKKRCLDCGRADIVRQYNKEKSTFKKIVWTDEYECMSCKTRFTL